MRFRISLVESRAITIIYTLSILGHAGSASPRPPQPLGPIVEIKWFGQASFLITTSRGTTVITDPIEFKGYHIPPNTTADVVTVSHEHIDHNCADAVSGAPLIVRGTNKECRTVNGIDTTVNDVRLYSVPSFHDPGRRRVNAIFVLEFDGIRMVHLGDIGTVLTDEQVAAIGEVDILMMPVGGQFTIAGQDADRIVEQLAVKRLVLPMHYKTESFDDLPYGVEPFLEGKDNVRWIVGNELTFDVRAPHASREYVVLQY